MGTGATFNSSMRSSILTFITPSFLKDNVHRFALSALRGELFERERERDSKRER